MNRLTIDHMTKIYTERKVFDDASFSIQDNEKIGVLGINGTGKSTLLKIMAGTEGLDEGTVTMGSNIRIGYLPQTPGEEYMTITDQSKILLNKLGRLEWECDLSTLSGGQRKCLAIANILSRDVDILILDEPTNHLDHEMTEWLEQYLMNYKGAVVMVTHDRYFLDRVSTRIIEIDKGKIYSYPGNYSEFVRLKAARMDNELASERKRQTVLRTEMAWLARGARARATKQKAHIDRIQDMLAQRAPVQDGAVEMNSAVTRMGRTTIEAEEISKSYGDKVLFTNYSYIFLKGDRIGIIGANGSGKSTLIKTLIGEVMPDHGTVEIGETIKIGYFSQENETMDESMRVIDYIRNVAEIVQTKDGFITASQLLEQFLFDGVMQWSEIGRLSGGERRRLYLLKILMDAPNVLILDEPTNDLDIQTLTILEDYLDSFIGIVITVSHDRYFLDRVVRRIFAIEGEGVVRQYEGSYSDYLLRLELEELLLEENKSDNTTADKPKSKGKPIDMKEKKLKLTFKENQEYKTIDEDIEKLEALLKEAEKQMVINATDYGKLAQYNREKEELEEKLMEKMERWEYLSELTQEIEDSLS